MRDAYLPLVSLPRENVVDKVCGYQKFMTLADDCSKHTLAQSINLFQRGRRRVVHTLAYAMTFFALALSP